MHVFMPSKSFLNFAQDNVAYMGLLVMEKSSMPLWPVSLLNDAMQAAEIRANTACRSINLFFKLQQPSQKVWNVYYLNRLSVCFQSDVLTMASSIEWRMGFPIITKMQFVLEVHIFCNTLCHWFSYFVCSVSCWNVIFIYEFYVHD